MLKRGSAMITLPGMLFVGSLIAACGSGDPGVSSQVVSGVAATGSPLAGQVTLRDSSPERKDKLTVIASDGSFSIDVEDMHGPFLLRATGSADGVSRTLYSFTEKPGTANINPLSTVAVANAAEVDDPATVFDNPDAAALIKLTYGMGTSVDSLKSKLKPLLDRFSVADADPVSDPFKADHSGLDGVFDNVNIVLENGMLTIANATTGALIFTAQIRDVEGGRFTGRDDDVPRAGPRPAASTAVSAQGGEHQVKLSSSTLAGADSNKVYRSSSAGVTPTNDARLAGPGPLASTAHF